MLKIAITHDLGLSSKDMERLNSFGEVVVYNSRPESEKDWLGRCEGADIICCGMSGLRDAYQELKDVFISVPYVGTSFLDKEILKKNNIKVSNSPGCNKDAVAEWIAGMTINLLRNLPFYIGNNDLPEGKAPEATTGLVARNVLVIGKGNIGIRVGEICTALKMNVDYFEKGDNLTEKAKDQDILINCLSSNETSKNLLNKDFFGLLKEGSYFISVSSHEVYDAEAMFEALDEGLLAGSAIDDGLMSAGDTSNLFYQRLLKHKKVLTTPHIAYNTDVTDREGNRMMIDNIEAYLSDKPINLVS
jgi:phosphoglycerate dehydrogenase-like enzyme